MEQPKKQEFQINVARTTIDINGAEENYWVVVTQEGRKVFTKAEDAISRISELIKQVG